MKLKILLLAAILSVCSFPAFAASTVVSGQVLDANGNKYANGRFTITYQPGATVQTGVAPLSVSGILDATGTFTPSLTLFDNSTSGSTYRFNICAQAGQPCFQTAITITGATQTITTTLTSAAASLLNTTPVTATTLHNQIAPVATPSTGNMVVYGKTSDKGLYYKDDAGTETGPLGSGGGSVTLNDVLNPTADKTFAMGTHNLILSAPKFFSVGVLPSVPDNYLTGPLIVTGPGPNNEYGEITLWYPEHGRASVQLESAGGPLSAPTASGLGDYIGNVEWLGAGTDTFPDTGDLAAQIVGIVDKNPGPGVVRARLEFHTSNGTGMSVERVRINSDGDTYLGLNSGNVGVGVATGSVPAASLEVSGGVLSTSIAVASLPAAAAGNKGQIRTVSDSTAVMTEGQTCAGMGSATALAFSDGTQWKCF